MVVYFGFNEPTGSRLEALVWNISGEVSVDSIQTLDIEFSAFVCVLSSRDHRPLQTFFVGSLRNRCHYYRGLNNCQHYLGFLIMTTVEYTPKPYSNY